MKHIVSPRISYDSLIFLHYVRSNFFFYPGKISLYTNVRAKCPLAIYMKLFIPTGFCLSVLLGLMFFENPHATRYFYDIFQLELFPNCPEWILLLVFFLLDTFVMLHVWMIALFQMFFGLLHLFSTQYWQTKIM